MKIALVGSSGYIASFLEPRLAKEGKDVLKIDKTGEKTTYLDLEAADSFDYSLLEDIGLVVFTAAISGPDKCAEDYELCRKINVDGTVYFIRNALSRGCRVLFFSSDAVYGDIPGYIYTEASETQGKTAYGLMKKAVEDEFTGEEFFKAIRLSYVVSSKDRFISYCLDCMRKNTTAEIYHPFYRNCVSVANVIDTVSWFSNNFDEYKPTFLNVTGLELVSRVRIADELNRIYGERLNYIVTRPGDDFFRNRPMITQMKSIYMDKYRIFSQQSFTTMIQKEMEGVTI